MQRMPSGVEGADPQDLGVEDERLKARLSLITNVAAFGVIVLLLRVGKSVHQVPSVPKARGLLVPYIASDGHQGPDNYELM